MFDFIVEVIIEEIILGIFRSKIGKIVLVILGILLILTIINIVIGQIIT